MDHEHLERVPRPAEELAHVDAQLARGLLTLWQHEV